MNKIFLVCACLLANVFLLAQSDKNAIASVFFETGQSALSESARQHLDALSADLRRAADYQVNIEAFTDDRGTDQYNHRLAADRASAVQQYLQEKGLQVEKSTVKNWGERKAIGKTDDARQQSRRVDVRVTTTQFEDYGALRKRLSAGYEQVMPIDNSQEQTLTAAKGTMVIVPANAFVFEDGTAPKGTVNILIQEAYDPFDFIAHNLTTTSNGQILQTGGMVRIEAISEGKKLRLAEDASLIVAIPNGGNFDPEMELFYAQPTVSGGVNWKPAGQKFRNTLRPTRIELNIDPALGKQLAALKVTEYPQPSLPAFQGIMPPEPKAPTVPVRPRAPRKPDWNEYQRLYAGGGQTARLSKKELKKAQSFYQEQLERYERDSAKYVRQNERYQHNLKAYEQAKADYQKEVSAWENELYNRIQAVMLYQREMRLHCYSLAVGKALKAKAKTIQQYKTYSNLYGDVDRTANEITEVMMLNNGFVSNWTTNNYGERLGRPKESNLFRSYIGMQVIDNYKNYKKIAETAIRALPQDTCYRAERRILAATGLKAISDSLQNEIRTKTMLTSTSSAQRDVAVKSYVANVSSLGWINCDRFYKDPAEKMQVVVNEPEEATLYAVCKDLKAMLPFNLDDQGNYVANGLPKGKTITVVAIKIKDGMPNLAQFDMKVGNPAPLSLNYKSLPLQDLKEELKKISI